MNGYIWDNMVNDDLLKIQVGVCFTIEPSIAIVDEFSIQYADCLYITG